MIDDLARQIVAAKTITVITGAGVSAASGIPTFRTGDDAVWSRNVMEMGTFRFFMANPSDSWHWYAERLQLVEEAEPNAAHTALSDLQKLLRARGQRLALITQNVDGLHSRVAPDGEADLIEVHGALRYARCVDDACCERRGGGILRTDSLDMLNVTYSAAGQALPHCEYCGALIRPHVLWFDETYDSHPAYGFDQLQRLAFETDLLLFAGTSFSVGLTEYFLDSCVRQLSIPAYSIDPSGDSVDGLLSTIARPAEEVLPTLRDRVATEREERIAD